MIDMGRSDEPLNVYSERQLVHEIGYQLRSLHLWVGFEQRYAAPEYGRKRDVADILAYKLSNKRETQEYLWIEVKSTGLTEDGRRENSFSTLRWKRDIQKLGELDNRLWGRGAHYGYWAWLYLFKTYSDNIHYRYGNGEKWTRRTSLSHMANTLGQKEGRAVTLPNLLREIAERCPNATCSCIPSLTGWYEGKKYPFSALLVTAKVK